MSPAFATFAARCRRQILGGLLLTLLLATTLAAETAPAPTYDPLLGKPFVARNRASLGSADAQVVIVEFTSFTCAHCKRFEQRVFPRLKEEYIDTGRVRYVAVNVTYEKDPRHRLPIAAARAAHRQDRYWEMREALFSYSAGLPDIRYDQPAIKAGLDLPKFKADMMSPAIAATVEADLEEAASLKITGTPVFLVRRLQANGEWQEARLEGYQDWDFLRTILESALSGQ